MDASAEHIGPLRRVALSLFSLLAADAVLLVYVLGSSVRAGILLKRMHSGDPMSLLAQAVQIFALYAMFTFIGWLILGLPIALLVPARAIVNLRWPLVIVAGAALGPIALLLILFVLSRGALHYPESFQNTRFFWLFALTVSLLAFAVYSTLLKRAVSR
jgi:hypothetical protein